ncbi:MAG TPA: 3-deoxy-manno-octulosonate cytidylyltransferase [Sandaracinaceae bacterium LLY-WYZ-13_1]|nr:3-deoxy-manno-octulosonate cytidylyltransferase [Sandaracinaceae bacterium LLY-WYZ-13_1]
MTADFRVVIPARYASQRLPGKALLDVGGAPLVVRCLERAMAAGAAEVVVAVDDPRIAEAVQAAGGEAQMTSPEHPSGTDRLAEVVEARGWDDDAIVVNLQGDEPLVPPALLSRLAAALDARPSAGLATMAVPITEPAELFARSAVKVVLDDAGMALYFSRAPIPWVRDAFVDGAPSTLPAGVPFLRHLGLYAYRVSTLRRLSAAPRASLEAAESLEQLRALALGLPIHVTVLDEAPPPGVDTPEDLARVRQIVAARA